MSKSVLITGANRGIGLALTELYLTNGWIVYASCRDITQANELTQLQHLHTHLTVLELDVTDHDGIQQLSHSLHTISLDLLINNAGYYGPKGYGFGHTDAEEWRKVFEINTIAPLKLVEAFYPQLKAGKPSVIACLSSKVGSMAENTSGGGYIYRSSKAALNSVVKSLSNDLQPEGIVSVALHPGWVQTEMGGPNALVDTHISAKGIKQVIDNLTEADSGLFIDYQGNYLPW
ncbi:SDR family oxidoreductase [Photobacterium minamisatsumaniensis]|uniref:SDR family oxidoreductase n=1 Tax=Photobacterium minamisatsumaniensis TaxID=2910233 RepID=UPI003D137972